MRFIFIFVLVTGFSLFLQSCIIGLGFSQDNPLVNSQGVSGLEEGELIGVDGKILSQQIIDDQENNPQGISKQILEESSGSPAYLGTLNYFTIRKLRSYERTIRRKNFYDVASHIIIGIGLTSVAAGAGLYTTSVPRVYAYGFDNNYNDTDFYAQPEIIASMSLMVGGSLVFLTGFILNVVNNNLRSKFMNYYFNTVNQTLDGRELKRNPYR